MTPTPDFIPTVVVALLVIAWDAWRKRRGEK